MEVNIGNLIQSVSEEQSLQKTASAKDLSLSSLAQGTALVKEAEETLDVATQIEQEIGAPLDLSETLEKVASQMEQATTPEDIIKIAEEAGNSDLAYISTIATTLGDAIFEQLDNRFRHEIGA